MVEKAQADPRVVAMNLVEEVVRMDDRGVKNGTEGLHFEELSGKLQVTLRPLSRML